MQSDRNIFINLNQKGFNLYNSDLFENIVKDFLKDHEDILLGKVIKGDNLTKVLLEVLGNNLENVLDRNLLYRLIEQIYDYWRDIKRYLFADMSESYTINPENYVHVFEEFNDFVLNSYRHVCENLLGHKFTILRELPAGGNAFVLLDRSNFNVYDKLINAKFISNVIFRPPFVVYSKSNKRRGVFPITNENPIDKLDINIDEWYAFPILVGKSKVFVYFKDRYMSQGLAIANLFTHFDDYKNTKPDMIVLFGANVKDGVYYDEKENIYVAALEERDEIDYFGYMKKIILTVHNVKMIKNGMLPIHGAGTVLTLKNHQEKNIVLIGDSGAGKSETLEALRNIANDYIIDMKTIFDDMGTFALEKDELKAYGTEIGAFVRTDDLENGYTYKVFDRAIFMNPNQSNARLILPVSTYEDITAGVHVDMLLYANNYQESDEKLHLFKTKEEALETFIGGKRVAKGTTSEKGLVATFFANPFGPVQLESETRVLLDKYFDYLFAHNIKVGEIYTGLALENGKENPVKAARELLETLRDEK